MELPTLQEQRVPPVWRRLLCFRGGLLTSPVIYTAVVVVYLIGRRLFGWPGAGVSIAFAGTAVLELLAGGITAVPASQWRRFGAGLAVGGGAGVLLVIAVAALLVYGLEHLQFPP